MICQKMNLQYIFAEEIKIIIDVKKNKQKLYLLEKKLINFSRKKNIEIYIHIFSKLKQRGEIF